MKKYFIIIVVIMIFMSCNEDVKCGKDITLEWLPPITNEDGTPLTDLAGFKVYDNKLEIKDVGNVHKYTHQITQGIHMFTVTAYNKEGYESVHSNAIIYSQECSQ